MRAFAFGVSLSVALLSVNCAGVQTFVPTEEQASCYLAADERAQTRVLQECEGLRFKVCPSKDSILEQLRQELAACK